MPKFAFRVSDQDEARLRKIAFERGVTLSDLGRMALEAYVDMTLTQGNRAGPKADPSKPKSRYKGKEAPATITGPRLSVVERILARSRNKPLGPPPGRP